MNPDRIADAVLEKYRKVFKSKGKEMENTNSWTVLAAIVAFNRLTNDVACVSLATGTDCLSKRRRDYDGILLADSHAEVLCHRAFKRFLLNEVIRLLNTANATSKYLIPTLTGAAKFELREGVEFALYTSHAPCGDCTMEGTATLAIRTDSFAIPSPKDIPANAVLRGRSHHDRLGVLRTKPGRADAEESDSHSCSDKISRWLCLGLGGGFVHYHVETHIRLSMLVVGDDFNHDSLQRGLNDRTYSWRLARAVAPLETYPTSRVFEHGRSDGKVPSSLASVWYLGCDRVEAVNLGRRQGFTKKWSPKASSSVSKLNLGILFMKSINSSIPTTYRNLKSMSRDYQEQKQQLLDDPSFAGWKQSSLEFEEFTIYIADAAYLT